MPTLHSTFLPILVAALATVGCSERVASPAAPAAAPPPAAAPVAVGPADAWRGQWAGPEGTFLKLAGGQGVYEVTIRNLDGPRTFAGRADGAGISFERDGKRETLRATDGAGTGMKWLAGKKDCLALKAGEGWCRD